MRAQAEAQRATRSYRCRFAEAAAQSEAMEDSRCATIIRPREVRSLLSQKQKEPLEQV